MPVRVTPGTIDEYIVGFPPEVQTILQKVRATIAAAAPGAQEIISYRMPAFVQEGILLYFGGFKTHIGIYPPISGDAQLERALSRYAGPKGNLRFPLDQPIPYPLIKRMVSLRLKQNLARASAKGRKGRAVTALRNRGRLSSTTRRQPARGR